MWMVEDENQERIFTTTHPLSDLFQKRWRSALAERKRKSTCICEGKWETTDNMLKFSAALCCKKYP